MITKEIQGNILDTELKYIAHGVNSQDVMGSGVAKVLFKKYPDVKKRYHEYCNVVEIERRLESVCSTQIQKDGKVIFNMFTQYNYGYDGKRYVNYAAIVQCLTKIVNQGTVKVLAIPRIGFGLAGGDWEIVKQLINDVTQDKLEVWVYYI